MISLHVDRAEKCVGTAHLLYLHISTHPVQAKLDWDTIQYGWVGSHPFSRKQCLFFKPGPALFTFIHGLIIYRVYRQQQGNNRRQYALNTFHEFVTRDQVGGTAIFTSYQLIAIINQRRALDFHDDVLCLFNIKIVDFELVPSHRYIVQRI